MSASELIERQAIVDTINKFSWAIDTFKPLTDYPDAFSTIFYG